MSYTVRWALAAEQELAALWLGAPDRRDVSDSAEEKKGTCYVNPSRCMPVFVYHEN